MQHQCMRKIQQKPRRHDHIFLPYSTWNLQLLEPPRSSCQVEQLKIWLKLKFSRWRMSFDLFQVVHMVSKFKFSAEDRPPMVFSWAKSDKFGVFLSWFVLCTWLLAKSCYGKSIIFIQLHALFKLTRPKSYSSSRRQLRFVTENSRFQCTFMLVRRL